MAIVALIQFLVTLLYCAFLADWGEREHIFMPVSCFLGHHRSPTITTCLVAQMGITVQAVDSLPIS